MKTKIFFKPIATLLFAAGTLCFVACSDEWDKHYGNEDSQSASDQPSLYELIKADESLQEFVKVLDHTGYDLVLKGAQALTVLAPSITSEQADSVIALYDAQKRELVTMPDGSVRYIQDKDNKAITQFVQNHIALYGRTVSENYSDTIRMMNGKYLHLANESLSGVPFQRRNVVARNGILYTLQGKETGRALAVPSDLFPDKIQGNAGFEALTYNAKTERFWTVTEKPLLADDFIEGLMRLQSFGKNLKPSQRALYLMDYPNKSEDEVSGAYAYVHGVPALAELDDGRLIVLEREVYVPNGNVLLKALGARTWTKLYLVDPVNDKSGILRKSLLTSFITSSLNLANFEGMCLGPKQEDGSQVLILIADSQNGSGGLTKEYIKVLLIR